MLAPSTAFFPAKQRAPDASSGPEPDGLVSGGRVDLYLNFDAGKLWGREGSGIVSLLEYR